MDKSILFIDYANTGFSRYAVSIAKALKEMGFAGKIIAIYMERTEINSHKYVEFDSVEAALKYNNDPVNIFNEFHPSAIILFAHRFFDYMFTIEAHRRRIPVFNFQHGLYMDSTVISSLTKDSAIQLVKKKRDQIKLYSKCIFYMCQKNVFKTAGMFKDLLKYHSLYTVVNKRFKNLCNADISFIYGKYWEQFYLEHYNENQTDFRIVGYPELEGKLRDVKEIVQNGLPTICYLAQTSVEDGLISAEDLKAFLEVINKRVGTVNVILKLHPRSDISLYRELINNSDYVKIWNFPEFPESDLYIGHESTVVARALLYITNKTMVYRLKPDRISPFEKYTRFVCTSGDEFEPLIDKMIASPKNPSVSEELNEFVYMSHDGAIVSTAEVIYDVLEGRNTNENCCDSSNEIK